MRETFIWTKYKFYTRWLNDAQVPDSLLEKRKLNVEWNVALKNLDSSLYVSIWLWLDNLELLTILKSFSKVWVHMANLLHKWPQLKRWRMLSHHTICEVPRLHPAHLHSNLKPIFWTVNIIYWVSCVLLVSLCPPWHSIRRQALGRQVLPLHLGTELNWTANIIYRVSRVHKRILINWTHIQSSNRINRSTCGDTFLQLHPSEPEIEIVK